MEEKIKKTRTITKEHLIHQTMRISGEADYILQVLCKEQDRHKGYIVDKLILAEGKKKGIKRPTPPLP